MEYKVATVWIKIWYMILPQSLDGQNMSKHVKTKNIYIYVYMYTENVDPCPNGHENNGFDMIELPRYDRL